MSTKNAYEKKMEAQLEEWEAEIDKLKARSKGQSADAEIEFEKKMQELETRKDKVREKLDDVRRAGDNAWDDVKDGVEKAVNDLGKALDSAKSKFSR